MQMEKTGTTAMCGGFTREIRKLIGVLSSSVVEDQTGCWDGVEVWILWARTWWCLLPLDQPWRPDVRSFRAARECPVEARTGDLQPESFGPEALIF